MIVEGNPLDATLTNQVLDRQEEIYGRYPLKVALDGGFASNEDERGLAEAIRHLLEDVPLRMRLIKNGMETAWRYEWDKFSTELTDVISTGLKGRR